VIDKLIGELSSIRPRITSYRRLLKEYSEKIHGDALKLMDMLKRQEEQQKKEVEEQKQSFDRLICASTGFVGIVIANALYATLGDFSPVYAVMISAPVFLFLYGLSATVLNTLKKKARKAPKPAPSSRGSGIQSAATEAPEDPVLLKELSYIFPKNDSNVMARVYTPKKLNTRIRQLDRIHNIEDEEQKREAIRAFQRPLMRHAVTIKIPDNNLPANYSPYIVIGRADFRDRDSRKTIAAYFRAEADKNRQHSQFNQKIVDYYSFIANEIEYNFSRYIRSI